jgi:hypothetical protein
LTEKVSASAGDFGWRSGDFEEGATVRAVGGGADLGGGHGEALAAVGTGEFEFRHTINR